MEDGNKVAASQKTGPGGNKDDAGKIRYDLLRGVGEVLRGVAQVLTFGARKYAEDSWQDVPNGRNRYLAAMHRHLDALLLDGEIVDGDSQLHHAWHFACNALFVAWFLRREYK